MIYKIISKNSTETCLSAEKLNEQLGEVPFALVGLGEGFGSCTNPDKHFNFLQLTHPFKPQFWSEDDYAFAVSYASWLNEPMSAGAQLYIDEYVNFSARPDETWSFNREKLSWVPPIPMPEEGFWIWDKEEQNWVEVVVDDPAV